MITYEQVKQAEEECAEERRLNDLGVPGIKKLLAFASIALKYAKQAQRSEAKNVL